MRERSVTVHAFTSFSFSYLDRARVLAATLRRQHPDWTIWAVVTDRAPRDLPLDWARGEFDRVLMPEDLFGGRSASDEVEAWLFGHDVVEACTAVKGEALVRILDEPGCSKVVYLDPDIAVLNPLTPATAMLDDHSIVLTPHQIDPEPRAAREAIMDNELASLQHGVYNLGFLAVAADEEGRRFARWWADRLGDWCHDRKDIGVFVDQRWCDLIPCFFDRVGVLRDPGCNVASWNLSQREVRFAPDGTALVNGVPLRFWHFTKLGPVGDAMTARYAADNTEVYEIWSWYRRMVAERAVPAVPAGYWHYGAFRDGTPIPKSARELYRVRGDLRSVFPRPFESRFKEWLRVETDLLAA